MHPSSGYLYQKTAQLLKKPVYACLITGLLALFPLTNWLSLAVMALVTLRLRWIDGVRCLIVGVTVSICFAEYMGQLLPALTVTVPTYVLCYVCAYLLRRTVSWQLTALVAVFLTSLAIMAVHYWAESFLIAQSQFLLSMLASIDQDKLLGLTVSGKSLAGQLKFAHYLFGVQALSVLFSAMFSLMLARSIQSTLYYPGGFKQEMTHFRASRLGLVLLGLSLLGVYENNLLALSCLPIFFAYLMMAGLSLMLNFLIKKRKLVIYLCLFLPMVLVPYVALPVYVLFGSVDSIFNLRSRLR